MAQIYFGKNHKLFVGLTFSKNDLSQENSFCFPWYFPLPFVITFPCSTIFSIVINCSCLGLWILFLFLKFLMCLGFVCCAGILFLMFQTADARNMMPYWRNFQSWLKLLINFIQFLELVFVNKIWVFHHDVKYWYLLRIYCVFYSVFCLWAVLLY